jgi:hypothetical protein
MSDLYPEKAAEPVVVPESEPVKPENTESAPAVEPEKEPAKEPAPEPKVEGDKEKPSEEKPKEEPVVPEVYDLKLPEGSLLDKARVDAVALYAKENKLSNEAAQKLLERENEAVVSFHERQKNELKASVDGWLAEVASDPELGGDNSKEKVALANRFINRFGSPKLREILDTSGVGNHPELLRMAAKAGKEFGEDKLVVPGAQPSGGAYESVADILYPKKQ